jgi:hypothetical protein
MASPLGISGGDAHAFCAAAAVIALKTHGRSQEIWQMNQSKSNIADDTGVALIGVTTTPLLFRSKNRLRDRQFVP